MLKDTDGDLLDDNSDDYPLNVKPDKMYIIYQDDGSANTSDALFFYQVYTSLGFDCEIQAFNGIDSFVGVWDSIGRRYNAYTGSYDSVDSYYNVTDVILIAHGEDEYHCIMLGNQEYLHSRLWTNNSSIHVSDLAKKDIDNLHLRVYCSSSINPVLRNDIPSDFIVSFDSIDNVYAFDEEMLVYRHDNMYSIVVGYDIEDIRDWRTLATGIFGQVVYHRGAECRGVVGIGNAYIDGIAVYYDDVYLGDQSFVSSGPGWVTPYDLPWENNNYFDPIVD